MIMTITQNHFGPSDVPYSANTKLVENFFLQVWYSELALEAKDVFTCGFSAHYYFHF